MTICYLGCEKSSPVDGGCHEGDLNKAKGLDVEEHRGTRKLRELKAEVMRKRPWLTGEVKIPAEARLADWPLILALVGRGWWL